MSPFLRTVNDAGRITWFNRHSNTQWHGGIRVDDDFVLSVYVTSQIRFNQVANPFRFLNLILSIANKYIYAVINYPIES